MEIIISTTIDFVHIGIVVRKHREHKGWTQAQLAEAVEVESSYISKVENGKGVSLSLVVSIAISLAFSLDEIMPGRIGSRKDVVLNCCTHMSEDEFMIFMGAGMGGVEAFRKTNIRRN